MTDFRTRLAHRFRKQQEFANGYSPLSARLLGIVADWLAADNEDEVVTWLLETGNGRSLHQHIAAWATTQARPILWLQWEPCWDGPEPPQYGWVTWTADLWRNGRHHHWRLAWNHPHGTNIHWQSGRAQFAAFWQKNEHIN